MSISTRTTIIAAVTAMAITAIAYRAFYHKINHSNSIQVTGISQVNFDSDLAVWTAQFNRTNPELVSAYATLKNDRDKVAEYLQSKGIASDKIRFQSVSVVPQNETKYFKDGSYKTTFKHYRLSQKVKVESTDIKLVEQVSREITDLINQGIEIHSSAPQYFYTKLDELKIQMLAEASKNARIRAEQIVKEAGGKLGQLRDARMGVFQIVARHSGESYSWGGTYNTSALHKTASITAKLKYQVE